MAKRRILFVCRANRQRSPTAERVFKEMLIERGYSVFGVNCYRDSDFEVMSAGIDADDESYQVEKEFADGFKEIFALDGYIKEMLVKCYRQPEAKIVNLDIADNYMRDSGELVKLLRKKLERYIDRGVGQDDS